MCSVACWECLKYGRCLRSRHPGSTWLEGMPGGLSVSNGALKLACSPLLVLPWYQSAVKLDRVDCLGGPSELASGHTRHIAKASMPLVQLRAGRCERRGNTNWVDPQPGKGFVSSSTPIEWQQADDDDAFNRLVALEQSNEDGLLHCELPISLFRLLSLCIS